MLIQCQDIESMLNQRCFNVVCLQGIRALTRSCFLYPRHTKYAMGGYSSCLFYVSVCQSVNIYFVSKISQELLYLET